MNARRIRRVAIAGVAVAAVAAPAYLVATDTIDFGAKRDRALAHQADDLYGGIGTPLRAPVADTQIGDTTGTASVRLASGLRARVVTDEVYDSADMIAFWPSDRDPSAAILCIENGSDVPGIQRVHLKGPEKGLVETILTGTSSCDGIRRTPWGTIVATEEELPNLSTEDANPAGWALEIYDPLETDGVLFDRTTGAVTGADAGNVHPRPAVGRLSWEGLEIEDDGTVVFGNELGPRTEAGTRGSDLLGGALYKFISSQKPTPATWDGLKDPANAAASPLAAGAVFALQVGDAKNVGQGNERGLGKWVGPLDPAALTSEAKRVNATGFYRPEDLHGDPLVDRQYFWANTGNSSIRNFGEVLRLTEHESATDPTGYQPEVQTFAAGTPEMGSPDNIAVQPRTGMVYVIQDSPYVDGTRQIPGGVWACLRDGGDVDLQSDGCVRVLDVTTAGAEPTGFIFDATGKTAYMVVQHSPLTGESDDMLKITGFDPWAARAAR